MSRFTTQNERPNGKVEIDFRMSGEVVAQATVPSKNFADIVSRAFIDDGLDGADDALRDGNLAKKHADKLREIAHEVLEIEDHASIAGDFIKLANIVDPNVVRMPSRWQIHELLGVAQEYIAMPGPMAERLAFEAAIKELEALKE